MENDSVTEAIFGLGAQIARILGLLQDRLPESEDTIDYDQTYVVTGATGAPGVTIINNLPRTLRYVEIELTAVVPAVAAGADNYMALFTGNGTIASCQAGLNTAVNAGSNATCVTGGGRVKCREYLDQSGYLTVYMNNGGIANVRIRSLDIKNREKQALDIAAVADPDS
jgi:hypothetical protein